MVTGDDLSMAENRSALESKVLGTRCDGVNEVAGDDDGATEGLGYMGLRLCRHRRQLYLGIADGPMVASPTALGRHRRRLYVAIAGNSVSASPTGY